MRIKLAFHNNQCYTNERWNGQQHNIYYVSFGQEVLSPEYRNNIGAACVMQEQGKFGCYTSITDRCNIMDKVHNMRTEVMWEI